MNEYIWGGIIVYVSAVLPCFIFGYLIAFKGRRSFITGWSDSDYLEPEKAGKVVGISLMLMAIFLGPVLGFWVVNWITEDTFTFLVFFLAALPLLAYVYVKAKYGVK